MGRQTLRVLLIEHSADDARRVLEMLQREGPGLAADPAFELLTGGDAAAGVRSLREQVVDVVLLDLPLPEAPGLEALHRIRTAAPGIPVVVLACPADEPLACAAVGAGALDYLIKGHTESTLLVRTLRYAVERQELRTALERLSLTDKLTGLYNRRGFGLLADQQLRFADRTNQDLLFVLLTLTNPGRIAGRPGSPSAEAALRLLAQVLRETFRNSDIVGRVGPDRFAVLAIDAYEGSRDVIAASLEEAMTRHGVDRTSEEGLATSLEMTRLDPEQTRTVLDLLRRPAEPPARRETQPPRSAPSSGNPRPA